MLRLPRATAKWVAEHQFDLRLVTMAGQRPPLRPEEREVVDALVDIFPGVTVDQCDDGSRDSMYDLDVTGPTRAAVEVGRITDRDIQFAADHWRKKLTSHETTDLKWQWTFVFDEDVAIGRPATYPRVTRPATAALIDVLQRLEARGIQRVGRQFDYAVPEAGGWRIGDDDIRELFALVGDAAEDSFAVDLSHHGVPGGWTYSLGHGNVSRAHPDGFAADVESLLHDAERADMRAKLAASGQSTRIAALVFDSTTGPGWATAHVAAGPPPTAAIELPTQITHVLVLGMNGLQLLYSAEEGWTRHGDAVADATASTS
jgi:hypothetical protein